MAEYDKTLEQWQNLGISNDFLFEKIMQDSKLCKELLEKILPNLDIDRIEYSQEQKVIRPDVDAKSVRLDVYVKDGKGTVYDIEMQAADTKELAQRARYYQDMIDIQLLDKGEQYKNLKPCYIIFICLFDLFGKGRHIYTFKNICEEDTSVQLKDGTAKIFLNAKGEMDDVSEGLKAFLDYVAGKKPEDPFVKELEEAVKKAKQNRKWRSEYMTLLMKEQFDREEGRKEGRKEGREEGILGTIASLRKFAVPDKSILQEIMERYHLTELEANQYIKKV